jgi:hypothetical protein
MQEKLLQARLLKTRTGILSRSPLLYVFIFLFERLSLAWQVYCAVGISSLIRVPMSMI